MGDWDYSFGSMVSYSYSHSMDNSLGIPITTGHTGRHDISNVAVSQTALECFQNTDEGIIAWGNR